MDERWVIVAEWADSSPTVHGPYSSADAAERAAARAWSRLTNCTGWNTVLMQDGPVPNR